MTAPRRPRPPLSKAARNERRKLLATSLNTAGLGGLAVGLIQPVFAGRMFAQWQGVVFGLLIYYLIHMLARRILRDLED